MNRSFGVRLAIAAVLALGLAAASPPLLGPAGVSGEAAQAAAADDGDIRWIGLGDSYSSGEGLPHPSDQSDRDRSCQRARGGKSSRSVAWGSAVAQSIGASLAFVACTGAITDDLLGGSSDDASAGQLDQAVDEIDDRRFDVVSLSFGGNNIGFADLLLECAGVSVSGGLAIAGGGPVTWLAAPWVGCSLSESEMKARVDALTAPESVGPDRAPCDDLGSQGSSEYHWDDDGLVNGKVTLPELFDVIARCVAAPGAKVVVMGYPQLIEESGRWGRYEGNRCHRVRRADVGKLRGAAAHLNHRIAQAVSAANRTSSVDFEFIDPNHFWEGGSLDGTPPTEDERALGQNRHGLCGAGTPWLNGLTLGVEGRGVARPQRSFHPNQLGHDAMAQVVSTIEVSRRPPARPDPGAGIVSLPHEACFEVDQYLENPRRRAMVDGVLPISESYAYPPVIQLERDSSDVLTYVDLDGDRVEEVLALVACATGGSGFWHVIVAYDEYLHPIALVPLGEGEPDWEYTVESVGAEAGDVVVTYRGGEEDEARCCGTRWTTDSFDFEGGEFVRVARAQRNAGTSINEFIRAVNSGDRTAARSLATSSAVDAAFGAIEQGGPLLECFETHGEVDGELGVRYCLTKNTLVNWEVWARLVDGGGWEVSEVNLVGGM